MGKLWTGKEFKDGASLVEVQEGLKHLKSVLINLGSQIRPDLTTAEAEKLLATIDQRFDNFNANVAAINEHKLREMLVERAAIIAGITDADDGETQGQ